MRSPRGHVAINGDKTLRPRVATTDGDLNLIICTHGTKPDSGEAATVLGVLVRAEQTNENFHRDTNVLVCVVAVMEFSNSNAGILGLTGCEAGWNLDFTLLTVGAYALDDVLHGFITGVIFTVTGKEIRKWNLEFLHVVADIARIRPHFDTVCLDGDIYRGHGASNLEGQFVGVLVEFNLRDGHGGIGWDEHDGRIGCGGDEQRNDDAGTELDLVDAARHAFGLNNGTNTDHQHDGYDGQAPRSTLKGENGTDQDDDPTGKADFRGNVR